MGDPIQPEFHAMMNDVARALDRFFNGDGPRRVGFILLTAEFGKIDGGRVNYISNGNREDMIAMLREYLARAEGRYQEPPEGKPNA